MSEARAAADGRSLLVTAWVCFCLALPLSIAGANLGWALVLAALLAGSPRAEALRRAARTSLVPALVAYCLAAVAASAFSTSPSVSFGLLHKDLHKLWLCLLFGAGLAEIRSGDAEVRLLAALAAGLGAAAVIGIFQSLDYRLVHGAWLRAHAFVHPVAYGEMQALGLLGAACFLAAGERRRAAWPFAAVVGVALLLSQTRAAIVGVAAGLALLAVPVPPLRMLFAAGSFLAAAAAAAADLMPNPAAGRSLLLHWGSLGPAQVPRWTLWGVAWSMFRGHPWLGVGPGNFRTLFTDYHPAPIDGEIGPGSAHNVFLHQLAERGLIGAAALAALFAVFWARAWRRVRERPDPWNLWALAATAGFTVMNMTETAWQTEQVWMLYLFIWTWAEARHTTPERS